MNILMLGNSFTYFNDMPGMLAANLDAVVVEMVRGGAYLRDFLNPDDPLSHCAAAAIDGHPRETDDGMLCKMFGGVPNGQWHYVFIQEQSFNAVGDTEDFLKSVKKLCDMVKAIGAVPVLYESWAYRDGSEKLAGTGMTYEQMRAAMLAAYERAAEENGAVIARAGEAFANANFDPYEADDYHPNARGSRMIACVLAAAVNRAEEKRKPVSLRGNVELRDVNKTNWLQCAMLTPGSKNSEYIPSNALSLTQAAYMKEYKPLAIYAGGMITGFVMYRMEPESNMWDVTRFMVEARFQHMGIGRAALVQLCERIRRDNGSVKLCIFTKPENIIALKLYERMGFEPDGYMNDDGIRLTYQL